MIRESFCTKPAGNDSQKGCQEMISISWQPLFSRDMTEFYFSRFRSMDGAGAAGFSSGTPCSRICMNCSPVIVSFS